MSQLHHRVLCAARCIMTHNSMLWPLSSNSAPAWLNMCVQLAKRDGPHALKLATIQRTDHSLLVCLQPGQRNGVPEGSHRCHRAALWGHCRAGRCLPRMGPQSSVASASGGNLQLFTVSNLAVC